MGRRTCVNVARVTMGDPVVVFEVNGTQFLACSANQAAGPRSSKGIDRSWSRAPSRAGWTPTA